MASRHDAVEQCANTDVALRESVDIHEQICQQHNNERTSLFCRKHMVVICGRCLLQNHMKCENQLVDLNEVSHPTTDHINELMHGLESIISDTQCLNKDVSVKRENNNLAKEDNFKTVRDFRKDIDTFFDNLQRKAESEITQCHVKNEDIFTEQIKTCLDVEEEAQTKLKHINYILEKKQKSTIFVTTESLRTEIATLKQTLHEASRKPMGPMYEFHKNDVVQNMILTENLLGTVEYIHTGSDELTDIIDIEESSDEEPPPWNDETGLQLADLPEIPRITIPVNLPIEHCKPSLYARQISPQEPPPGYNEIRLQPEDPPKIQRNIIPVDQSIQQCQPSLYARQISPQGPSPVHSGKSLQFQSPRGLTYIRNPDFPPIPQGQPLPPPRYKAPQRQGLRIPDRQQESSSIQTSSQEPSMKINNEQEPITGVVVVADIGNCPPGYTAIERDIGDFWMGKHYMCIGRDASSQCRTVLVDVCFVNKQVPPPSGFTLIDTTYDTREEWTQKRIYVSWMNTSLTTSAITDITFVKKNSKPPKGYTIVGDLHNLEMCYKMSKIRT